MSSSDPMLVGVLVGAVVGAVLIVIGLVVAFTRTSTLVKVGRTRRMLQVQATLPPQVALARIVEGAPGQGFAVEDHVPGKGALLSTKPTFTTWGFFYPVLISPVEGGCLVEVGIASKFVQIGPLVTSAHKRSVKMLEGILGHATTG